MKNYSKTEIEAHVEQAIERFRREVLDAAVRNNCPFVEVYLQNCAYRIDQAGKLQEGMKSCEEMFKF